MKKAVVTIADVARHAGVSVSTVSYVLSGKRTISASTSARVKASIRALGFHPHAGADQAELGEDRPQRVHLAGVAAVERRQGEQGGIGLAGIGHGRRARRTRPSF